MKLQPIVPVWLLVIYLIAVSAFIVWQFLRIRRKGRPFVLRWLRRSALLVMPAVLALGPSVQGGISSPGVSNLDIIFAIDTTPSMGALDYVGNRQRIEGAKQDIRALAAKLQGAHMEIVTFDSEANVILPLTTDPTAFSTAVEGMTPQINSYSQGSTIDKSINLVTQELKNSQAAFPEHIRLLFYLGDGEQTADAQAKSFAPLARYVDGGAVLGYGTAKGARMIKYTGIDGTGAKPAFITTIDATTNQLTPAVSHLEPAALQKIATQLKTTYQNRNQGGPVDDLYRSSKAQLAIDHSQRVIHYLNLYWLFAIPYAGLIFWEWQNIIIKLFELRDQKEGRHA